MHTLHSLRRIQADIGGYYPKTKIITWIRYVKIKKHMELNRSCGDPDELTPSDMILPGVLVRL